MSHPLLIPNLFFKLGLAALAVQFFILNSGCSNAVEDVSQAPPPKGTAPIPTVVAALNGELIDAGLKNFNLRAQLMLDTNDYSMSINNGTATWQDADLPVQSAYDVTVQIEIETDGAYVAVAKATAIHDFSVEASKSFTTEELHTNLDADGDGMSNLAEILVGGNPNNEAPTFISADQISVMELSNDVLTVRAISPRTGQVVKYSILLQGGSATQDNGEFTIDPITGRLSFTKLVNYDNTPGAVNQYSVTLIADDGSSTSQQVLTVSVTDVFDLKYDVGFKQLQFHWSVYPNAAYYKILQSVDGGNTFAELAQSGQLTTLTHNHLLTLLGFEFANIRYKLQAYNDSNDIIQESPAMALTAADLTAAIGYFKSIQPKNSDFFGKAVTLSADGSTLAVGANGENASTGAVHVYRRTNGIWQPQASFTGPNSETNDAFGTSVALSADGNTLAVGAYREGSAATAVNSIGGQGDNSALTAGAVYVYTRVNVDQTYTFRDYVKAPNSEASDWFGGSVALSADGNTLAVGANGEDSVASGVNPTVGQGDNTSENAGAAYVYTRVTVDQAFVFRDYIKAPNSEAYDDFGVSVALSANGNTLAVAANNEDSAASAFNLTVGQGDNTSENAGAVYVYMRGSVDQAFAFRDYIKASNSEANDWFGWSIALSADGNTLAVGASLEDSAATGVNSSWGQSDNSALTAGAVYVYTRVNVDQAFAFRDYVKASNSETKERFGHSVALSADGNTLAVGASLEGSAATGVNPIAGQVDNSAPYAGAVYVYTRGDTNQTFAFRDYIKATNSDTVDLFGQSLALSADGNTLAVGAHGEDSAATGVNPLGDSDNSIPSAGAVYLY